jgi:hypothetical protein
MSSYPKTPAAVVLEMHRKLYSFHAHPSELFRLWVQGFMGDVQAKVHNPEHGLFGQNVRMEMMFYPYSTPEQAPYLINDLAKGLMNARTYQVTADMCDAIDGMYATTYRKVSYFDPASAAGGIAADCGFAWLDKPWIHDDVRLQKLSARAVSWQPVSMRWGYEAETDAFGRKIQAEPQVSLGWRITMWSWLGVDPVDESLELDPSAREFLIANFCPLVMLHTMVWPAEVRFGGHDDSRGADPLAWLHCLWLMLDSEITTSRKALDLKPDEKKKAQRARMRYNDVNVVTLRRTRSNELDDFEPGQRSVDWSCRWMVAGHYRHLGTYNEPNHHAYPAYGGGEPHCHTCGVKLAYVHAYLKGPDHAPLRHTDKTLYRLSR